MIIPELDEPYCKYCGRCVLCGPPCCEGSKREREEFFNSPEYKELARKQKEEGKALKAKNKEAKKARRAAKLAARNK